MKNLIRVFKRSFLKRVPLLVAVFTMLIALNACKHDKNKKTNHTPKVENVVLTTVKVAGKPISIANVMDAGKKEDVEVTLEFATDPSDATLSFVPTNVIKEYDATKKKGVWTLADGENILTVTVTKGAKKATYTLKITKEIIPPPIDVPKLKSITIAGHKKEGEALILAKDGEVQIPVPINWEGADYDVEWECNVEGTIVTFEPPLETGNKLHFENNLSLEGTSKSMKVIVEKGDAKSEYNVVAIMLVDTVQIFGARHNGKSSTHTKLGDEKLRNVLDFKTDTFAMYGANTLITFGSFVYEWEGAIISVDGVTTSIEPRAYGSWKSVVRHVVPLELGKKKEIKVMLSMSKMKDNMPINPNLATAALTFTLESSTEKADAFISEIRLNGNNITNEKVNKNAFTDLFDLDEPAEFEIGNPCEVEVVLEKEVKSVKIDSTTIDKVALQKMELQSGTFYVAKASFDLDISGNVPKDIKIVVDPLDEDKTFYGKTTMALKLIYKSPPKMWPRTYTINGKKTSSYASNLDELIKNEKNPPISCKGVYLNMRIVFDKEPSEVSLLIEGGEEIKKAGSDIKKQGFYMWYVDIGDKIEANEKQVTLTFIPKNTGSLSNGVMKFKVMGTVEKEKIEPRFISISGDQNLSKENFLDKLTETEESNFPIFCSYKDEAEVVISFNANEYDNLLKEVRLNGEVVNIKVVQNNFGISTYTLKEKIKIESESKLIKLEFFGKENVADDLIWNFKLTKGGVAPSVPKSYVGLRVQGKSTFTDEFLRLLKEDKEPTLEVYGKDVEIAVFAPYKYRAYIQSVEFKIDDDNFVHEDASFIKLDDIYLATHKFEGVSMGSEHSLILKIKPNNNPEGYKDLELKLKIKVIDEKPMPSSYSFSLDTKVRANGYKAELDNDVATFIFRASQKDAKEVKMGRIGNLETVEIKEQQQQDGSLFYLAFKDIELDTTTFTDYIIEVTPEDDSKYATIRYIWHIKGIAPSIDDASFVIGADGKLDVRAYIKEWKEGVNPSTYTDDYGSKVVNIVANLKNKASSVQCYAIDVIKKEKMSDFSAVRLLGNGHIKMGDITLYDDKPTMIKAEVTAEDGSTKDSLNGVRNFIFNPIPVFWSYKYFARPTSNTKTGYNEIRVKKSKIKKDGKAHFIFAPWQESLGYVVKLDDVMEAQDSFTKLATFGQYQQMYKTALDISNMKVGDHKYIQCKIMQKGHDDEADVEAFTYKLKIIIED